jgi:hypothetical protein
MLVDTQQLSFNTELEELDITLFCSMKAPVITRYIPNVRFSILGFQLCVSFAPNGAISKDTALIAIQPMALT